MERASGIESLRGLVRRWLLLSIYMVSHAARYIRPDILTIFRLGSELTPIFHAGRHVRREK